MKTYYIYIVTNASGTYYVGVTNSLERRIIEHASGKTEGFTQKYRIKYLLYYEQTDDINLAIAREKQLKGWRREKKANLIRNMNPKMEDLFERSFGYAQDDKIEATDCTGGVFSGE